MIEGIKILLVDDEEYFIEFLSQSTRDIQAVS